MEKIDDAKDALVGADLFVGVLAPGILKHEIVKSMNKDAIIFAMANSTTKIMPGEAKAAGARGVVGTGRSVYPNQVNNALAFQLGAGMDLGTIVKAGGAGILLGIIASLTVRSVYTLF